MGSSKGKTADCGLYTGTSTQQSHLSLLPKSSTDKEMPSSLTLARPRPMPRVICLVLSTFMSALPTCCLPPTMYTFPPSLSVKRLPSNWSSSSSAGCQEAFSLTLSHVCTRKGWQLWSASSGTSLETQELQATNKLSSTKYISPPNANATLLGYGPLTIVLMWPGWNDVGFRSEL